MRMRYENGAQTGRDRGIDVRARTVSDHKSQRRIEVRVAHQAAIGVDVLLARSLDPIEERTETGKRELVAQAVVTCGREFGSRLMQRHHVRTAAVAMRFDKPHFGAAHRGVNLDARDVEDRVANGRSEEIERLEKMDVGIPERVVGVEYEVQRLSRSRGHLPTAYRRALERANGQGCPLHPVKSEKKRMLASPC